MALFRLSLAAAAAGVAAAAGAGEDAAALLQVSAALERESCECMNWDEVYAKHGHACGEKGPELEFAGMGAWAKVFIGQEFCTHFYEKYAGNRCTQLHFGKENTTSWCYVSPTCGKLNGGAQVGNVSWKICQLDIDLTLGDYGPEELYSVAEKAKLDAGLMMKMSYPVYQQGLKWPAVMACLNGTSANATECAMLKEVQATRMPMIFDSLDGHPPFGVVTNTEAWETHFSAWFREQQAKKADIWTEPWKMCEYVCVAGCED